MNVTRNCVAFRGAILPVRDDSHRYQAKLSEAGGGNHQFFWISIGRKKEQNCLSIRDQIHLIRSNSDASCQPFAMDVRRRRQWRGKRCQGIAGCIRMRRIKWI